MEAAGYTTYSQWLILPDALNLFFRSAPKQDMVKMTKYILMKYYNGITGWFP